MMTEEFVQYVWKYRLMEGVLQTTGGERITVIHPGEQNRSGGPDFFNARIRIEDTLWAGSIEVHLLSSDWLRHHHHLDRAYDNVILHVVVQDDMRRTEGNLNGIPVIVIGDKIPRKVLNTYDTFLEKNLWIPCERLIREVEPEVFILWAPALAAEKLTYRSGEFRHLHQTTAGDWQESFYRVIARAMGFRLNALPFELLATSTPYKILSRHRDEIPVVEAILFGQANLLPKNSSDEFQKKLSADYGFYRAKYSLVPLEPGIWKFLRMRPANFPTIRISQFGALAARIDQIVRDIPQEKMLRDWRETLRVNASEYWNSHYIFGRETSPEMKKLGDRAISLLLINAVIPFKFFFGVEKGLPDCAGHALSLLEQLPGEENAEISQWQQMGMPVEHALNTQALLWLKTAYCDRKRCLECRLGTRILNYER